MRLKNTDPTSLIGKTIIYRGQFWRVDVVEEDGDLRLGKNWNDDKGRIRQRQLADCRLYPAIEDIAKVFPRLMRALCWGCILTPSEAESCIQGYITTGPFFMGAEAVAHIGGAANAIRHALRGRHLHIKSLRAEWDRIETGWWYRVIRDTTEIHLVREREGYVITVRNNGVDVVKHAPLRTLGDALQTGNRVYWAELNAIQAEESRCVAS